MKLIAEYNDLKAIADSIREKTSTTDEMRISEMPALIEGIKTTEEATLNKVFSTQAKGRNYSWTSTVSGDILVFFVFANSDNDASNIACSSTSGVITELSKHYAIDGWSDGDYTNTMAGVYLIKDIVSGGVVSLTTTVEEEDSPVYTVDILQVVEKSVSASTTAFGTLNHLDLSKYTTKSTPSSTSTSNSTYRTWTKGSYITGLAANNYYNGTGSMTISGQTINFTNRANGYQVGFVLRDVDCKAGDTVYIVADSLGTNANNFVLAFYKSDGQFISAISSLGTRVQVPSNATYVILLIGMTSTSNLSGTLTGISINKANI